MKTCNSCVTVEETSKSCSIRDMVGNLRYKVNLYSIDDPNSPINLSFFINVANYFYNKDNPIIIVQKPDEKGPMIYSYDEAIGIYNDYVKSYTNLIKAETRDFQDISIYSDKINYNLEKPKCCATCHWSKRNRTPEDDFTFGVTGTLECWNPKCCAEYGFDPTIAQQLDQSQSHILGENVFPTQQEIEKKLLLLHPKVDPFGLCKFYEIKEIHYEPIYGDSLGAIVDRRVNNVALPIISSGISTIAPPIVSSLVSSIISSELTAELSTPVIQAITLVLSSPEASVALSAPVVNLITNSQEIQAQTVNIVGNALSNNILSTQMTTAVSTIFENPSTSSILEIPISNAMQTPTVKAQTINVIGDALSNNILSTQMVPAVVNTFTEPEISTAMITPVANVIPTNEVSSSVISVAVKGITIDQIIGNNGLRSFNDINNNGFQDDNEPDIIEESLAAPTLILGGDLGA